MELVNKSIDKREQFILQGATQKFMTLPSSNQENRDIK